VLPAPGISFLDDVMHQGSDVTATVTERSGQPGGTEVLRALGTDEQGIGVDELVTRLSTERWHPHVGMLLFSLEELEERALAEPVLEGGRRLGWRRKR
jgi:hypothetical protein